MFGSDLFNNEEFNQADTPDANVSSSPAQATVDGNLESIVGAAAVATSPGAIDAFGESVQASTGANASSSPAQATADGNLESITVAAVVASSPGAIDAFGEPVALASGAEIVATVGSTTADGVPQSVEAGSQNANVDGRYGEAIADGIAQQIQEEQPIVQSGGGGFFFRPKQRQKFGRRDALVIAHPSAVGADGGANESTGEVVAIAREAMAATKQDALVAATVAAIAGQLEAASATDAIAAASANVDAFAGSSEASSALGDVSGSRRRFFIVAGEKSNVVPFRVRSDEPATSVKAFKVR